MTNEANKGIYATLREINVNEHTEKKGNLTYLSWVWALDQLYLHYPEAVVEVHKNPDGWPYWTDGRTCWVDVEVRIGDLSRREYAFPVMNYQNKSIPLDKVTSFDVNTSIQRAVTRCIARGKRRTGRGAPEGMGRGRRRAHAGRGGSARPEGHRLGQRSGQG